ncbi:hypothetical protein A5886_002139 [Enterococcus sp. 8G7_MSG3316]|uniref:N-acetylmuramoyl-L-alanine amidase n=1 Tax=Candidatus Enterococcus testudinis TaxID=1834191 RepID=A0A242A809_9ENTE|nr:N-acetylmuramoyl-L-alanine amidase [Enterococcus sp. 8G7_MSG3316]OTN77059.1 hypothetical protein A5886_002139 [Enterococcus sp. 8G7_MSG3316]
MSFIKYEYININKFSRPGIKNYGIKGLIMHYTANNGGTARNHKTYFNNLNGIYASAHLFVDDNEAICIIPLNEVAYHANDTVKYNSDGTIYKPLYSKIGNANYGAIGLEMCLDKNGNITEKTFQNSVKAVKELVAKYPAITRNTIWRHYDVTGKNCPAPWVSKPSELARFKEAVFGKNSSSNNNASTSKPAASTSFKVGDKVKITDALYKDSTGAGRSTASRGKTGTIKRVVSGNKPYLIDSLGWAHKNDIQLATSSTTTATKKVGDTVTVQSHATQYQTGQNIPSWVKGKKYKIKQIKSVNQSKSKKAYLLEGINSWFLEQDVK